MHERNRHAGAAKKHRHAEPDDNNVHRQGQLFVRSIVSGCSRLIRWFFCQRREWHERSERNDAKGGKCPTPTQCVY